MASSAGDTIALVSKRERWLQRQRQTHRERGRERERECVCVCERDRQRGREIDKGWGHTSENQFERRRPIVDSRWRGACCVVCGAVRGLGVVIDGRAIRIADAFRLANVQGFKAIVAEGGYNAVAVSLACCGGTHDAPHWFFY